jgi:hypothetical protein
VSSTSITDPMGRLKPAPTTLESKPAPTTLESKPAPTTLESKPSATPVERIQAALLACALALPGAVLILATAVMLLGLPFGVDPLWQVETLTLPEAAALRDNGEVVRLIDLGEDPNRAGPVRQNFLRDAAQVVTPLEAAVGARRADMVELLLQNGAVMDAAMWTRLMCFAEVVDAGDVRDVLEPRRPANASDRCADVPTPW